MKNKTALLTAAALAPALLAFALPGDSVAFKAAEGLSVTRTFKSETHLTLDDMEMSMNGQPLPMEIQMDMTMDMSQTTEVTDRYQAVGAGRPSKLVRSYDQLSQRSQFSVQSDMMPDGGQDRSIGAQSDLQGKKVAFTWSEDEGAFVPSFADGEGDAELLEGLEEDMDLRSLLPAGEVAEGDTWDVDVKMLRLVLSPGGNLKLKPDDDAMEDMGGMPGMDNMGDMNSFFEDVIEGDATAEYKGRREVDGVECGVIALRIDISASADMTEKVSAAMQELPDGMGEMEVDHMDFEIEMEGEGTLYWDLAAGVPHSFDLSGETRMTMDMGFGISMGEQSMNMEQTLELSGSFSNELKVTKN